jgi:hypothetical protein
MFSKISEKIAKFYMGHFLGKEKNIKLFFSWASLTAKLRRAEVGEGRVFKLRFKNLLRILWILQSLAESSNELL